MDIPGLTYIENFVSVDEEHDLVSQIDNATWLADLKRRVQHYGYKYDYKKRQIDASMKIDDIPVWAVRIADRVYEAGYIPYQPDQLIINEYLPGQGIASHIDCEPCFEDTIISLSLGSHCVMTFTEKESNHSEDKIIHSKSLLVMQQQARYKWMHGIKAKKSDMVEGVKKIRQRRISLTFRKVILS
ncbi:alpha-ketoglutarate-dependent dioxygenase AlkB [Cytophagaceae bacterium DM2B3-1]|uniref:Alpha-ketoglutarate-dependent dioxygenase AlkB n=1 Tax=Xanthocytophaga flava TaxID=3048013 RepID=A0ABT7CFK6_9BACT|nr:alpha-ketoglutarate-dependent dioxygenase AlkB [Xanthocytophaga flavus]MDJ1470990.1 alpha-ketoglutarate-dependent dioxygenase AlkB [Xanthocytophaga flavus]MDJ1492443.1 alpha-ketoglutarate-dependent dioxygenase AlkB [Xanthocytophaga flavus]